MKLLSYRHQGLREFPEEIRQTPRITNLNLSDNQIERIPAWVTTLKNLQVLYLNNNQITNIDKLCDLPHLEVLQLNNNQISSIPGSIRSLTNLKRLYINNNLLVEVPTALGALTQLKQLLLAKNQLVDLPDAIGKLINLTILNLFDNRLEQLPDTIGNLTQLTYLQLGFNCLVRLPHTLQCLQALTHLEVFSNQLHTLPELARLPNLQKLNVGDNYLSGIEQLPASLTEVSIYHNPLEAIASELIDCFKNKENNLFEYLYVDTQQMQRLNIDPQEFDKTLKVVDLANKKASARDLNYMPLELRQKWQIIGEWT
ncbi:leucine-rich repeat domain-containing protein [Microscilla marina]|uniref:Small GTP-binding protein domain n=1 Tax=Microscilla marina ATCC 23134 TaxID=313606 RepID=A1ZMZ5_MICM2|nr:leucine-rich repeat domain-containing protein [Microscilla marina]EAY28176.1 small GTP-binding protein domain [Microscilla marina ATCC 23134]